MPDQSEQQAESKAISTKFSDLTAFHQSLHTRLALILAAYALTAAAVKPVSELLPTRSLSVGATPFLVYAAAFAFVGGVIAIVSAFRSRPDLQAMTLERLASRSLSSPDETSEPLQKMFVADCSFKLNSLGTAHTLFLFVFLFLLTYAVWVFLFSLLEAQFPYRRAEYEHSFEYALAREAVNAFNVLRWWLISLFEQNRFELLGQFLRRSIATLLFEAVNLLFIVIIILIVRHPIRYFDRPPPIEKRLGLPEETNSPLKP